MNRTIFKSPDSLCIYSDLTKLTTLNFLSRLNNSLFLDKQLITLDLSKVTWASAAASLILFSIVNRAQLVRGNPYCIRFIFPNKDKNNLGHGSIVKTGLSRALNSGSTQKLEELTQDNTFFQSSSNPSSHLFSTIDMLQQRAKLNDEQILLLSSGISEAMLNVSHHAYNSSDYVDFVKKLGKRWWQCAWFDPKTDSTIFLIYDLGIGVVKSFNKNASTPQEEILNLRSAFTAGNTRFNVPERGKGTEDIKSPILSRHSRKEKLIVYTGSIEFVLNSDSTIANIKHENGFVQGTLIQWELFPSRLKNDD
jgi:hypothetical protein